MMRTGHGAFDLAVLTLVKFQYPDILKILTAPLPTLEIL